MDTHYVTSLPPLTPDSADARARSVLEQARAYSNHLFHTVTDARFAGRSWDAPAGAGR